MTRIAILTTVMFIMACGNKQSPAPVSAATATTSTSSDASNASSETSPVSNAVDDFGLREGDASGSGASPSDLKPSKTHALLKLIVQDGDGTPIPSVVVKGENDANEIFYTPETDATGYAETLVPIGHTYTLTYLSLFEDTIEKKTAIPDEPNISMKLTLTYTVPVPPKKASPPEEGKGPALVLNGVVFDTAKATLKEESFPHLEKVVEYMTYKPSAIIEISGHTDSRGNYKKNLKLSEDRAASVKTYLVGKGIDEMRIISVGYGPDRPIATNDTEEGRQLNRRVEARDIEEL